MKQHKWMAPLASVMILLPALSATAQQAAKKDIYHKGWTDLNKDGKKEVYEDASQPVAKRVQDLVSRMNLTEKACQLTTLYGYGAVLKDSLPTPEWKNEIWANGIANIDEQLTGQRKSKVFSLPYSAHAGAINKIQRFFVEDTRLGIPVDFTDEGIAGLKHEKATAFPRETGQGSTFDKPLIRAIGDVEGKEARALGYTNIYAPEMDVSSDPRWGRVESCYGSSPYLCGQLGDAMIAGIQSHDVASTLKHFAVYSIPVGGRDGGVRTHPRVAPREMREIYLEPFREVIEKEHPLGVMASYNEYDGVPIIASKKFMTDILRKEYGFNGYVVSDSRAVEYVYQKHHVAPDYEDAIRQVLEAGLDVRTDFTKSTDYIDPLIDAVKKGKIPMSVINKRVAEVLSVKYRLGLFDHPYVKDPKAADTIVNNPSSQKLALRAAHEAIVLLKNEGHLLPLDASKIKTLAVVGPNAKEVKSLRTGYGPSDFDVKSIFEGVKEAVPASVKLLYAKGINHTDPHFPESDVEHFPLTDQEKASIDSAVAVARRSDVVIMALGDGSKTIGESHSRVSLDLPGHQEQLLEAVAATGKPVVLLLVNGRPLTINWAVANVPAIVETWYLGEATGTAIADVLFGKYNPGGKLAIPFPKSAGQAILTFPMKPGDEGSGRARVKGFLYPFGYGLSYTTFKYSGLTVTPLKPKAGQDIKLSFTVTNTGGVKGDAVPQLYIDDELSSVTTYVKKLRGFTRLSLAPGESKPVTFTITPHDLGLYDRQMKFTEEPGWFTAMIGSSSEDIQLKEKFDVIAR
ncbi:MAG TPA: glycoside hydrolase family 3 N-terminal domain-containing protein [Chitinophagaceae bacterium]|nr:glycoside hydrolase family 3 N-terminal domain-containing protein [Chitinophagaceae bacterium]